jgi:multisubunit Na+/H+ antiporter MnhB subunit
MMVVFIAFIVCASLLVLSLIYLGVKREEGEFFGGAALALVFLGLLACIIASDIQKDDRIKECISQGKHVIKIEETSYCKL